MVITPAVAGMHRDVANYRQLTPVLWSLAPRILASKSLGPVYGVRIWPMRGFNTGAAIP